MAAIARGVLGVLGAMACSSSPEDEGSPGGACEGDGCASSGGTSGTSGSGGPQPCTTDAQCEGKCNGGTCVAPNDADGKKNNGETDVDCGGANARKCGVGKACVTATDCGLAFCKSLACAEPSPSDKVQNGTETDVDCGGAALTHDGITVPAAPKCALAKQCAADADCSSAVCADTLRCIEAPSCRPLHGGSTCGKGEFGVAGATHESCCRTLPIPGLTMVQGGVAKQVYLDKYEITSGRVRAWVTAIKAQYAGVPNVQAWVKTRMAADPILAAMFPSDRADYLPAQATGQPKNFKNTANVDVPIDIGMDDQIGPTSYYRGVLGHSGTSGCGMYPGSFGHRTYWYDAVQAAYYGELARPVAQKDWLDEKSMNCAPAHIFAAFCAWDGGYLPTQAAIAAAYGPSAWPWGDTPTVQDEVAKMGNYNAGTGNFGAGKDPRYLFPIVNYGTFANDFSPIIAAPGRFPKDRSQVRPLADTWMDLGSNMLEWSHNLAGQYFGSTGSSFEGHVRGPSWESALVFMDKYGKSGARCMRLK